MDERIVLAKAKDVIPGKGYRASVNGRAIVLFNVGGEYYALLDRCPHEGASLCAGRVIGLAQSDTPGEYRLSREGEFVRCPWHGWEFEIKTGQSYCGPNRSRVKQYRVSVESGAELVKGPYKAETISVTLEDDFLVMPA